MAGNEYPIEAIQIVTGPDSSGEDPLIEAALSAAGIRNVRIDADDYIRSHDRDGLKVLLDNSAATTLVVSGIRWANLVDLVGREYLPNAIVVTSNTAITTAPGYEAKLTLRWPAPEAGVASVVDAVKLLNSRVGDTWQAFEAYCTKYMTLHIGVGLSERQVAPVPKRFDMVSADGRIIGDAKFFTMVGGERMPPAKLAEISAMVWLLQNTYATRRFLVFGNDKRVPVAWLAKYGSLAPQIEFFFLADYGDLSKLI